MALCIGKGHISSYSFYGVPGDSLYPHWVCLHARVCVWGGGIYSQHKMNTQCGFIMLGALEQNPKGEIIERPGGEWAEVVNQSPQKASM